MKASINKIWLIALLFFPVLIFAQVDMQIGDTTYYKTLIPEAKQGLLKNVSMIANMRFAERNEFIDGDFTKSRFTMEQFRMEFRGQVHEKVYFRFRNRYTKTPTTQSIDNIFGSVDLAFIRVTLSDKWNLTVGKMCADWGGYEFDANPIDIYEYADIVEMADNFLSGIQVSYQVAPKHSLTFQALDSRTKSFEELYGEQPDMVESKVPLALVANWRGSFFNGKFNTIWSYALHTEAENVFMNYVALGNQLRLGKFTVEYDYKLSLEDLDRTGIISSTVPDSLYPYALQDCLYNEHWLHLYYRVSPKINIAFIAMLDFASWKDDLDPQKADYDSDAIRTAWGFIPTVEYYPFNDLNLRFYANWVGRIYNYSDYAKERFDAVDYTTGRFSIGFVSPLAIF